MVLHGIFTGSKSEIAWLNNGGFSNFFPDVWDAYLEATPKAHRKNPSAYHYSQALGKDKEATKKSAYSYNMMEGAVIALNDNFTPDSYDDFDPAGALIEMHYMKNGCFLPDRYVLDNAHKLTMPIWLVQGRYDNVCPPVTAYELSKELRHGKLVWTVAGHASEHETTNILRILLSRF